MIHKKYFLVFSIFQQSIFRLLDFYYLLIIMRLFSRFNNSNTPQNLCNDLGISILWRQKIPKDDNIKLGTILTDFGLCCTVAVNYDSNNEITKPRAGKATLYSLLSKDIRAGGRS